ncbi:DUF4185 domain-containing protein [Mycobacterium kubicae]|uniref:DUF4185 domain-containing protein n=1 Tax=Mycobacterium kubicae TaxID=120959 RepID=UPI000A15B4A7|nr:DUF4185 domain-containing protein [Mycobacterium kubicae]MCV7098147.1 DUF4185 domain-containing protein [Mycobacterium kubicae]QNI12345.1 DUF4185 domain-containing protein [Mycobacterium kubicae]
MDRGASRPLPPGGVRFLGPIAGTGADPGIPGIGAADLGEVVQLPDGRLVAIFGDCFAGDKIGGPEGDHYRSVAVPITGLDRHSRPIFGTPFNKPGGPLRPNVLFPPPPQALGLEPDMNTLPAGSIVTDGRAYVLVVGTRALEPHAGSWLVEVSDDPAAGWQAVAGSWRPAAGAPTQISGFQATDGMVYIVADSFNRSQGITMYRADPARVTDRSGWQPWTGSRWGAPGRVAAPVSPPGSSYGELSFREVDGRPVLVAFDSTPGVYEVQVRVADTPTKIFRSHEPIIAAQQGIEAAPNYLRQPYGGYILPGSTLDNLRILVSQWNTGADEEGVPFGAPYNTHEIVVNARPAGDQLDGTAGVPHSAR